MQAASSGLKIDAAISSTHELRVLQAMAGAVHGGAEIFFERLVVALNRRSLSQKVVIRSNESRRKRLLAAGLDVVELPFGGILDFKTSRRLKRIVLEYKPHIVLTWMNRATAKMPRGPFVHMARLGGYYDVKYYRNCDYLIGNTPDIARWLIEERGWPKERVCNISNFVAWTKMDPLNRNSLDTPSASKLLLALGRLHQNKGFDTLLRALPLLPGTYLWLAGEGPEEASLRALAKDLGVEDRVRFLGWRQDVPALMAAADAFVCPSRHEPLGNVILEAWASGTPTVATAAEGPRDLLTSGEDGILVAIDRPDELARAINRVLKDGELARRLAQGGAKTYEARFKEETIVEEYLRIFRKCAESQA